jgi:hypothetical protein
MTKSGRQSYRVVASANVKDGTLGPPIIEIRQQFDAKAWQVASPGPPSGATVLLTWTADPEPVDAGVPPAVLAVLGETFVALGPCWFAGDEGSGTPVAAVRLRRGISSRKSPLFRVDRPGDLTAAFEAGAHDWSQAAQWIVIGAGDSAAGDRIIDVIRTLLQDAELPGDWPAEVSAIIQAGVDGDAAGCHCRTHEIEQTLRDTLQRCAAAHGVEIRTVD